MNSIKYIIILAVVLAIMNSCKRTANQEIVQNTVSNNSAETHMDNSIPTELTFEELIKMDAREKIRFYGSLIDSLPDIWQTMNVDATSYAEEDSIPSLPEEKVIHLTYKEKVHGYRVKVDYVNKYDDIAMGQAILRFLKAGHSFEVYCSAFSDEQLIVDDSQYDKSQKTINLSKVRPGANIYLNYIWPQANEYLSARSPFYFKDMDFDGEQELVVNNLHMGSRGYNTYDVFKILNVKKPLRLKGRPFTDDLYKITNYNVEYEPQTKSVVDKRYNGVYAYGHYRYKSIQSEGGKGLKRIFILDDAEDMGYYHLANSRASDSIVLLRPYKMYVRVNGRISISERGVYEQGNYGWNSNTVVLSKE